MTESRVSNGSIDWAALDRAEFAMRQFVQFCLFITFLSICLVIYDLQRQEVTFNDALLSQIDRIGKGFAENNLDLLGRVKVSFSNQKDLALDLSLPSSEVNSTFQLQIFQRENSGYCEVNETTVDLKLGKLIDLNTHFRSEQRSPKLITINLYSTSNIFDSLKLHELIGKSIYSSLPIHLWTDQHLKLKINTISISANELVTLVDSSTYQQRYEQILSYHIILLEGSELPVDESPTCLNHLVSSEPPVTYCIEFDDANTLERFLPKLVQEIRLAIPKEAIVFPESLAAIVLEELSVSSSFISTGFRENSSIILKSVSSGEYLSHLQKRVDLFREILSRFAQFSSLNDDLSSASDFSSKWLVKIFDFTLRDHLLKLMDLLQSCEVTNREQWLFSIKTILQRINARLMDWRSWEVLFLQDTGLHQQYLVMYATILFPLIVPVYRMMKIIILPLQKER